MMLERTGLDNALHHSWEVNIASRLYFVRDEVDNIIHFLRMNILSLWQMT